MGNVADFRKRVSTFLSLSREEAFLLLFTATVMLTLTFVRGQLAYNQTECVTVSVASGFGDQRDMKISLPLSSGVHDSVRLNKVLFHPQDYSVLGNYVPAVFSALGDDNGNAPFYFFCLATWVRVLDFSPCSFRLFNILMALISSVAAYRVAQAYAIPKPAPLIAGALVTMSGSSLKWMLYTREYNLSIFLSFLTLLCLCKVMTDARWRYFALLGISLALQLLTHYFAVGFVGTTLAFLWISRPQRRMGVCAAAIIAGLALCGWLSTPYARDGMLISKACTEHLQAQQAINPSGALAHATIVQILREAVRLPFWMCGSQLEDLGLRVATSLCLGIPLVAVAILGALDIVRRNRLPGLSLCVLSVAGILVSSIASLKAGNVYPMQPSYQAFYAPIWMLFLAAGLGSILRAGLPIQGLASFRRTHIVLGVAALLVTSVSFVKVSQSWFDRGPNVHHLVAQAIRAQPPGCQVTYGNWSDAQLVSIELLHRDTARISQRVTPGHRDQVFVDTPEAKRLVFNIPRSKDELYWIDSPLYTPRQ